MKVQDIASHIKVNKRDYGHYMSVMGEDGKESFNPTSCKEEMFHCIGKAVGWDYDEDLSAHIMGPEVYTDIDFDNPTVFYYINSNFSKKKKLSRALRILRVLTMLAESQDCKAPIVMADFRKIDDTRSNNLIAIEVDKFYFESPLAMSGLLTMIRAAIKTSFVFNTLRNFVSIMISDKNKKALADKTHLRNAKSHEILDGFLDRTLDTFSLKPKEAFRRGRKSSNCYRGIAEYTFANSTETIFEDDLYDL